MSKKKELKEYWKDPHWSYSAINTFLSCSLQFYYKYVLKVPVLTTPANLVFGNALHRAAEFVALNRQNEVFVTVEEAQERFSDAWFTALRECKKEIIFKEGKDKETLDKTGRRMMECLVNKWPENEDVLDICHAFRVPLVDSHGVVSEKPLIGEIDLIVSNSDGEVVLVDWKSAAKRWAQSKVDKDYQSTSFVYGYNALYGGELPHFRFDVVTKAKTPTYTQFYTNRDVSHFERLCAIVRVIEETVANEVFIPNEQSFFCGGCDFKAHCKKWHCRAKQTQLLVA